MSKMNRIMVKGKPFLSLGGQSHNSSSYVLDKMGPTWQSIKAIGGNTLATPVPWDAFEPEEGQFNYKFVTDMIDEARRQGIKLAFLWFATWKNGSMQYCPAWVKRDPVRFQRCLLKDGTAIHQLSAHSRESLEADKKAYVELIKLIKEYDSEEQTVIAVQVENEAGIQGGTRRDFSPLGEAAFAETVPAYITDYCKENPCCILAGIWKKNGCKEGANWQDTFGYYGAEAVTAHAIACYIDEICAAGKEIYPELFMYLNVWLDGGSRGMGQNLAGIDWPSGCANIHNLDIYYATLKYIDTVAPDNYQSTLFRHREITDAYANPEKDYPLYVPESAGAGINIGQMFYAFAEKKAIGYHIFGSESCLEAPDFMNLTQWGQQIMHNFKMLSAAEPLIFEYQDKDRIWSAVQEDSEAAVVLDGFDGDYVMKVTFVGNDGDWPSSDFRHRIRFQEKPAEGPFRAPEPGRAMVFQESEKVFYFIGQNATVTIEKRPPMDGSIPFLYGNATLMHVNLESVSTTEGHFDEDGKYQIDLVRSGDEGRHGIWLRYDVGVVRVEMT